MILPQEIIRRKRDGLSLSEDELRAFFGGFLKGEVADYQVSAMLMAVLMKGMTHRETADLTRIMRDSGETFSWGPDRHLHVDKHSTGGIGDKTSIVLLPLCVLEGLIVPMMAGRGLGHTGGTLDKLEAVGFHVFPSPDQARKQVKDLGGVFMGQTEKIVPLDRKLYSMRDVTATVESMPLIVGSILSKKLAEGIGGLVMDVKFGSGAFMEKLDDARSLAEKLKAVGQELGLSVRCLLTSMNSPLGTYAGNALEILECLEVLRGGGPADTRELTVELGMEMVRLAFPERDADEVRRRLAAHLASGAAYEKFLAIARAQKADLMLLESPAKLVRAKTRVAVTAKATGVVTRVDTRKLGIAIIELGGGRRLSTDRIDPWVGLADLKRVGAKVASGDVLATIHANDEIQARAAKALIEEAYVVGEGDALDPLVAERL